MVTPRFMVLVVVFGCLGLNPFVSSSGCVQFIILSFKTRPINIGPLFFPP